MRKLLLGEVTQCIFNHKIIINTGVNIINRIHSLLKDTFWSRLFGLDSQNVAQTSIAAAATLLHNQNVCVNNPGGFYGLTQIIPSISNLN